VGVRTVGVEEELLLVDPATREIASRSQQLLERHDEGDGDDEDLDQELFRHQVEIRTDPVRDLSEIREQLVAARRAAGEAATAVDIAMVASGTAPLGGEDPRTTRSDRYRRMVERYGEVARSGTTCGMHVHVAVTSPEEGVRVIDRIAPWLPVLVALSSNSPIAFGRDTGHASWRFQMWSRWPSAGPTERFGSVAEYERVSRDLVDSGAAIDSGMLYYDARLATGQPTIEIRVADVTASPDDAVVIAALVRALVETVASDATERTPPWRVELLRAAQWRASKEGCGGSLLDPVDQRVRPAAEVVQRMLEALQPALSQVDDVDLAREGAARLLEESGAARQRATLQRAGSVEAVVDDLIRRTELSWSS
jgi:carboxylate-amine ligase